MAGDGIVYDFGSNRGSLDDITGMAAQIEGVKQDIETIFKVLLEPGMYSGEGSAALGQAHIEINTMLDEALNSLVTTQKQAQDQQDVMEAMDKANAAAF